MIPGASLLTDTLPKAQFRAIILCGYGADLYPLIEPTAGPSSDEEGAGPAGKHQAQGQVKALLPVAGKKMVDWVIERVEDSGVHDILLLSPESLANRISHHLRSRRSAAASSSTSSPAKVDLEEVPEQVARNGTVAVVRWAAERGLVKTDFIVLPCDLLLSPASTTASISLASLLDRHRADDNLMTTLFSERAAGNVVDASKDGPSEILTIYDARTSTLLDIRELDSHDLTSEIPLRSSLLSHFPSPTLSTNLLPTQLYIFSSSILPLLASPSHDRRLRHMENLRDLAAWISRLSWRGGGKEAVGYRSPRFIKREDGLAMGRSTTAPAFLGEEGEESVPATGANTPARPVLRSLTSEFENGWRAEVEGKKKVGGSGGCKVVVWRGEYGWCGRGNTVAGWVEMNRAALKHVPASPTPTNSAAGVFISPDSFIHQSVFGNMGEKVGIKRCIIGKGSILGKGSKLTNVVGMENVVIGEGVKLENCVLSAGVQIRDRAVLKDCELGRDCIVDEDATLKNEQLVLEMD